MDTKSESEPNKEQLQARINDLWDVYAELERQKSKIWELLHDLKRAAGLRPVITLKEERK